jgi:nucleotide-binding universal stress UspA family protein
MTSTTSAPRTLHATGDIATAVLRELRRQSPRTAVPCLTGAVDVLRAQREQGVPWICASAAEGATGPVWVGGRAPGEEHSIVAAAVDDDGNPGLIIRYAAEQARRAAVPLRVVHVWTGHRTSTQGTRLSRHDRMSDSDLLLSAVLYDHLPAAEAGIAEREILHDRDPVRALIAMSAAASLIVVGARSSLMMGGDPLGDTVRGLVGRTVCPLVVLPPNEQPDELVSPRTW